MRFASRKYAIVNILEAKLACDCRKGNEALQIVVAMQQPTAVEMTAEMFDERLFLSNEEKIGQRAIPRLISLAFLAAIESLVRRR